MSPLPLLALPPRARELLAVEVTDGEDLRSMRTQLHRFLEADQPDQAGLDDVAQRVALVATELAGNALRHGLPPVVVRLLRDEDCYFLDASDQDPHRAPEPAAREQPVNAGGRGLHIVHALAQQLCWYSNGGTKHVWASFPFRAEREAS